MKVRLGEFFPRPEFGWFPEPARRCHKLGSHTVEIQGGFGVTETAARNRDAEGVREGLSRIMRASEELSQGLPEAKGFLSAIKNRAKALNVLTEPYGYKKPLPKRTSEVVRDQVRKMGDYGFEIEGLSIKACGGQLMGAHAWAHQPPEPLPQIPPELVRKAKKLKAEQDRATARRVEREHRKHMKKLERIRKSRAGMGQAPSSAMNPRKSSGRDSRSV